jgi:phospholipid/cholesterol/gamma-HCH transport system substrate-binding protein
MKLAGLIVLLGAGLGTAGCSVKGADSIPLPGGADNDGYPVTVLFDDATNLVLHETCRSNDVVIGSVTEIKLDAHLRASVTCHIKRTVTLPSNAVAAIESTSLLGERFVAIEEPPSGAAKTALVAHAVIDAGNSRTDPDVEQVFGALSAVLNGGDIARLGDITTELNNALNGHEADARGVIEKLDTLTKTLAAHNDDITRALTAVDKLSATLADQRTKLGEAIDAMPAGLAVLEGQRQQIVSLLTSLQNLSHTAVPLINRSGSQIVEDLRLLQPTLNGLAANGTEIADALKAIATFPLPSNAARSVHGDFSGIYVTFNLNANTLDGLFWKGTTPANASGTSTSSGSQSAPSNSTTDQGGLLNNVLSGVLAPTNPVPVVPGLLSGLLGGGTR